MGSIHFSDEHNEIRKQVRRFVEQELKPHGDEWEQNRLVPRSFLKRMGELGFLGIGYPEAYGGTGTDILGWVVLAEELGRSTYAGVAGVATVHTFMAGPHLMHAGSPEQLDRYLPRVISGELLTAIAVSEAGAASDVGAMRTKAHKDGDHWVLEGTKFWISNGIHADLYFVAARTDPEARGAKGISMFIVEKGTPGFRIGQKIEKLGFRASDTAELIFENCRVPAANLLGAEGKGFHSVMKNFQSERLALASVNVGEAITALRITLDYLNERRTFGVPLVERQAIRHRLAELHAKVEAGRQLVYHAASLMARGEPHVREVSMAKAYWGELINQVMYACLQYHGGAGFMEGSAIERMYRDARLYSIGGGATEIMLDVIANQWNEAPDWRE